MLKFTKTAVRTVCRICDYMECIHVLNVNIHLSVMRGLETHDNTCRSQLCRRSRRPFLNITDLE